VAERMPFIDLGKWSRTGRRWGRDAFRFESPQPILALN
jgi:hypothetical protein